MKQSDILKMFKCSQLSLQQSSCFVNLISMKKEKKKMFVIGGLRLGSSPVEFLINETKGDRIEQWNK